MTSFADTLFFTSTRTILSEPNEFLKIFVANDFSNQALIDQLNDRIVSDGKPIGEKSSVGRAWEVPDEKGKLWVVKGAQLCGSPSGPQVLRDMCFRAQIGDLIYRFPNTYEGKQNLLAPNYITESLIGILLSDDYMKRFTPSFPVTAGFQYDRTRKEVFTVMEKLNPVKPLISSIYAVAYTFLEIAAALNAAQKTYRYTHYDLHAGNFMSRPKSEDTVNIFQLNNGKYIYTLFDWDVVLIDFGFSRMETNEVIITPDVTFRGGPGGSMNSYYTFDPYYDLFTALRHTLTFGRDKDGNKVSDRAVILGPSGEFDYRNEIVRELMTAFLNVENTPDAMEAALARITGGHWRPDPNQLSMHDNARGIFPPCTPEDFMSKLGDLIYESQPSGMKDNPDTVANDLRTNGLVVSNQLLDLVGRREILSQEVFHLPPATMDTTFYPTKVSDNTSMPYIEIRSILPEGPLGLDSNVRTELRDYNRTLTPNSQARGNLANQFVHIAKIQQKEAIRQGGYVWDMVCCRIDIRNYLRSSNIHAGIAINASFFQINKNFEPIGYYRTPDTFVDNPPPQLYTKDYGMVGIDRYGYLRIFPYINKNQAREYTMVLSTGPMLVNNGNIVMTTPKMREIDNTIRKWQCRNPTQSDRDLGFANEKMFAVGELGSTPERLPNCERHEPGELSHASNPNPRSAIATKGEDVYLIYVEGRNERGDGMDLNQLALFCKHQLNADMAINLDGGRSSQLVWRRPGETIINQTNPTHNYSYPVGNIISLIK